MSEAKKPRTKPCPYCAGDGYSMSLQNYIRCTDCNGTGERCILCGKPPKGKAIEDCQCPSTAFDGDYSEMDRPQAK